MALPLGCFYRGGIWQALYYEGSKCIFSILRSRSGVSAFVRIRSKEFVLSRIRERIQPGLNKMNCGSRSKKLYVTTFHYRIFW